MIEATSKADIVSNIHTLHEILVQASATAMIACADVEDGNIRAAVGAVMPLTQTMQDARALLDAIFILNRQLN